MNKAWISIGSNIDSRKNLEKARRLLSKYFDTVFFTEEKETEPFGENYKNLFLNQLAIVYTKESLEETNRLAKKIEKILGRLPVDKKEGVVKIDIDVFAWNNFIVRPNDYERPYVQLLLPQLLYLEKSSYLA